MSKLLTIDEPIKSSNFCIPPPHARACGSTENALKAWGLITLRKTQVSVIGGGGVWGGGMQKFELFNS